MGGSDSDKPEDKQRIQNAKKELRKLVKSKILQSISSQRKLISKEEMNEKKANCCEEMLEFFEGILSNSLNNVKEFLDYWNTIKDSSEHQPYIDDLHKFLRDMGQIPTVVSMHHDTELN